MIKHRHNLYQDSADTETLQTDVMRFFAIIGLCLAAIFSLVQSAALDPQFRPESPKIAKSEIESKPEPVVVAVPKPKPVSTPKPVQQEVSPPPAVEQPPLVEPPAQPDVVPGQSPTPAPETASDSSGFTLEFASADALSKLLRGGEVQIYARAGERFWQADKRGNFAAAPSPARYYQMQTDTVPKHLRESLALITEGHPQWGVTLPQRIVRQLQDFTNRVESGNLIISGSGEVKLE